MGPLALVAAFGLLIGAGSSEVRKFERLAADHIKATLKGDAPVVTVKSKFSGYVAGPLGDLASVAIHGHSFGTDGLPLFTEPGPMRGRIRNLELSLRDFRLGKLDVARIRADIPECRFDYDLALRRKQIRLTLSGEGTGEVEVAAASLQDFIVRKFGEIKRCTVTLSRDRIIVEGYGEFIIVKTDFRVSARLRIEEGRRFYLDEAFISFGDRFADEASAKVLLDLLNPVVDLDRDLGLHGAIDVQGLRLEHNVLRAWGAARIPKRPE